jgi:hypothetical protein
MGGSSENGGVCDDQCNGFVLRNERFSPFGAPGYATEVATSFALERSVVLPTEKYPTLGKWTVMYPRRTVADLATVRILMEQYSPTRGLTLVLSASSWGNSRRGERTAPIASQ